MDLLEAVEGRRSVRKFTGDPVPKEDLREIVETASWAANAGNKQMWRFLAITNQGVKEEMFGAISGAFGNLYEKAGTGEKAPGRTHYATFFVDAPVAIAVLVEPYFTKADTLLKQLEVPEAERAELRQYPNIQSLGAAIQVLCLAAYAKGYGTCWMTGPNLARKELETILKVESPWSLLAIIALGRPAETPAPRPRKPVDGILTFID